MHDAEYTVKRSSLRPGVHVDMIYFYVLPVCALLVIVKVTGKHGEIQSKDRTHGVVRQLGQVGDSCPPYILRGLGGISNADRTFELSLVYCLLVLYIY